MYIVIKSGNKYIIRDITNMYDDDKLDYLEEMTSGNAIILVQDIEDIAYIDDNFDENDVIYYDNE